MKFGSIGNFEMLITKGTPKLKLENALSKKMQFSTDFGQAPFNNTVAMVTLDVTCYWFVFEIEAY